MKSLMFLAIVAATPAGAETYRLTPQAAEAARAEGEARALALFAREDAAAVARRKRPNMSGGLGIGTSALPPQGFAPLGDVGQAGFVYLPGSIGANRYRN